MLTPVGRSQGHGAGARAGAGPGMGNECLLVVSVDAMGDAWPPGRGEGAVENVRELRQLDERFERLGIRATYFATYPVLESPGGAAAMRELAATGRAEIGAYLQPWNTPPLGQPSVPEAPSLENLPASLQRAKVETLSRLLGDRLHLAPTAFRTGPSEFGSATAHALVDAGFLVDSSVRAFIEGLPHRDEASLVGVPNRVYRFEPDAGVATECTAGPVLEVPLSAGFTGFSVGRWPALNRALFGSHERSLRPWGIATRAGLARRIVLSPEGNSVRQMVALSRRLLAGGSRYLHMSLHSPCLSPGLTPFAKTRSEVERLYAVIEAYLEELGAMAVVRFGTVAEAARALDPGVGIASETSLRSLPLPPSPIRAVTEQRARPRLLVVTYHFPPDGAVGGLRWAGLTKYLARAGWEVRVLTAAAPPGQRVTDGVVVESRAPVSTLNDVYNRLAARIRRGTGNGAEPAAAPAPPAGGGAKNWWRSLRVEAATLLGLPDYARGWILPAARVVARAVRDFRPDVVVSSGPPQSAHLAAMLGTRGSGTRWIVDLRDPWALPARRKSETSYPYSYRGGVARLSTPWLERTAVRRVDCVVANTPELADDLQRRYPSLLVRCVPNGVDLERMQGGSAAPYPGLAVAYVGALYIRRDITPLLRGFAAFLERHPEAAAEARIRIAGHTDPKHAARLDETIVALGLRRNVEYLGLLKPADALELLRRSRLGVVLAQGQGVQVPAKLYELLGLGVATLVLTEPGSATAREGSRLGAAVVAPGDLDGVVAALEAARAADRKHARARPAAIGYDRIAQRMQEVLLGEAGPVPGQPLPVEPSSREVRVESARGG